MSAILGTYYLDERQVNRLDLEQMSASLAHRGPDAGGVWLEGSVGLGHRMLWTTPESILERLPFFDDSRGLAITADARIDNRSELIGLLGLRDRSAAELCDSHLIIAAYAKWGERCVERLLGDYVFAIWDFRNQRLYCARDPLGVKHFYYCFLPGRAFGFASEIKSLFCLPWVPREIDELSVAYHLLPVYDDKVNTVYKKILRLPACSYMVVTADGVRIQRSWTPDLSRELSLRTDDEYAEAFHEVFTDAVRCRLRSAFPVGSMLSGGLDSSSITCVAGRLLADEGKAPLLTFSAVWPSIAEINPKIDERRFMDAVTSMSGFDPTYIYADQISPLSERDRISWHQDGLISAPNMYMDWSIFKSAHERGARVLLGGTDGDTVVSYGYSDLAAFARKGRWLKLAREAKALSRHMPKRAHSMRRLVWGMALEPLVPELARQVWRVAHGRPRILTKQSHIPVYAKNRPLKKEFVRRINLEEHLENMYEYLNPPKQLDRRCHWYDISSGDWSYILECFEKAGGAHDLELRFPFFDRRVIEFCLSLPPGQKLQNGFTRSILRRAMEGILPKEVQWRVCKGNLSAGVTLKLFEHEADRLRRVLFDGSDSLLDYIDIRSLGAIYERYVANPLRSEDEAFTLMLTADLALWLERSLPFSTSPEPNVKHAFSS